MATGLIFGFGTTALWFAADAILLIYVLSRGPKRFRTHPAVVSLAVLVGITGFWSPDPVAGPLLGVRMILTYSAASAVALRGFYVGVFSVFALQFGFVVFEAPDLSRFDGLSYNAANYGVSGLVLLATPLAPVGAVTLGLSAARVPLAAAALMWVRVPSVKLAALVVLAAVISVGVSEWKVPGRFTTDNVTESIDNRELLNGGIQAPVNTVELAGDCGIPRAREWQLLGFGWHGYCLSTGIQRPHNIFVLSWWDLGVLAIPFWSLVGFGAWKLRDRPLLIPLLFTGMYTDELFRPESAYLVALALGFKRPGDRTELRSLPKTPGRTASRPDAIAG